MKKTRFIYGLLFAFVILNGCTKEIKEIETKQPLSNLKDSIPMFVSQQQLADSVKENSKNEERHINRLKGINYYSDWSGLVTICVESGYTVPDFSNNENWTMDVPSDFVCVGGGGIVSSVNNTTAGAFLYDSRPLPDLSGWLVSSKDHRIPDPHDLIIYAIGLKITGVSKAELLNRLIVRTASSPVRVNHPTAVVNMDYGYDIIGGGADITYFGYGCLLTDIYPANGTWIASGKDHIVEDKSLITAYAIGIKQGVIPGFGELQVTTSAVSAYVSSFMSHVQNPITNGWVSTCHGAICQYNGKGRMLQGVDDYGGAHSKDHYFTDGGTTTEFNILIRKKP